MNFTGVSLNNNINHDDDRVSRLRNTLRSLAPAETESGLDAAVSDILELVAAEIDSAATRAKEVPSTARFGVECIRRAFASGRSPGARRAERPPSASGETQPPPGDPSTSLVFEIRTVAARFHEANAGEASYTRDRLIADVKTSLLGQGRVVDEAEVVEAIKGLAI